MAGSAGGGGGMAGSASGGGMAGSAGGGGSVGMIGISVGGGGVAGGGNACVHDRSINKIGTIRMKYRMLFVRKKRRITMIILLTPLVVSWIVLYHYSMRSSGQQGRRER